MTTYTKSLLHLSPTYELITSKILFSLGYAVATVGVPLYFVQHGLKDAQIGIFTGLIGIITITASLYLPPILERIDQRKLLMASAFTSSISFLLFVFAPTIAISLLCLALAQVSLHVNGSALNILFKDSTRSKEELTRDAGLLGSFTNLGWFVGPILGGLSLTTFGFEGVFMLAASLISVGALYIFLFPFKTVIKQRSQLDTALKANIRFYIANPQLRIAYLQGLGVDFWWGLMWTFIPIFMFKEGYSGGAIGLFIALTQLPLFLLEFKTVGFLGKYGFRKIFAAAYGTLAVISLASFFILDVNFTLALGIILVASLALSFIEPLSNLFFFSKVSLLEEERGYPVYATSFLVGNMSAKLLPGLILVALYDKFIFILAAALMGFIAYRALAIKSN